MISGLDQSGRDLVCVLTQSIKTREISSRVQARLSSFTGKIAGDPRSHVDGDVRVSSEMRDAERQCGFVNGVRSHAYAYMRALMRHTATRVPLRERVLRVGINQSVH